MFLEPVFLAHSKFVSTIKLSRGVDFPRLAGCGGCLGGGVGGGVDQDVDDGGSPGGGLDDLTGFFPELLTPFAPTSPSELLIAVVFATPSILFILYSGQLDFFGYTS